jgi:hypothetical protein
MLAATTVGILYRTKPRAFNYHEAIRVISVTFRTSQNQREAVNAQNVCYSVVSVLLEQINQTTPAQGHVCK